MVGREFYENPSAINPRVQLLANPTPVLVLRGECDHVKWQVVDEYRQTFPKSTLLYFPKAGHIIYYDRPDLYLAAVRAFLLDQALPLAPYIDSAAPSRSRQP
jgi:proline iminopeptidase